MLLEEIGPDDEIGDIGLILERDEHGALGGSRLLAQEDEAGPSHVLLVDHLPAGFEIDNPSLAVGADVGALAWLGDTTQPAHAEFRDAFFAAAFDRTQGSEEPELLRVAYIVRAVSPGRYAHPPAIVEDMYRPGRFARTSAGRTEVTGPAR